MCKLGCPKSALPTRDFDDFGTRCDARRDRWVHNLSRAAARASARVVQPDARDPLHVRRRHPVVDLLGCANCRPRDSRDQPARGEGRRRLVDVRCAAGDGCARFDGWSFWPRLARADSTTAPPAATDGRWEHRRRSADRIHSVRFGRARAPSAAGIADARDADCRCHRASQLLRGACNRSLRASWGDRLGDDPDRRVRAPQRHGRLRDRRSSERCRAKLEVDWWWPA